MKSSDTKKLYNGESLGLMIMLLKKRSHEINFVLAREEAIKQVYLISYI